MNDKTTYNPGEEGMKAARADAANAAKVEVIDLTQATIAFRNADLIADSLFHGRTAMRLNKMVTAMRKMGGGFAADAAEIEKKFNALTEDMQEVASFLEMERDEARQRS